MGNGNSEPKIDDQFIENCRKEAKEASQNHRLLIGLRSLVNRLRDEIDELNAENEILSHENTVLKELLTARGE